MTSPPLRKLLGLLDECRAATDEAATASSAIRREAALERAVQLHRQWITLAMEHADKLTAEGKLPIQGKRRTRSRTGGSTE